MQVQSQTGGCDRRRLAHGLLIPMLKKASASPKWPDRTRLTGIDASFVATSFA